MRSSGKHIDGHIPDRLLSLEPVVFAICGNVGLLGPTVAKDADMQKDHIQSCTFACVLNDVCALLSAFRKLVLKCYLRYG